MIFLTEKQIDEIFQRFKRANPAPQTELIAPNPFTLLVSVVLSAQATDKSVNKATESLYKVADSPYKMAQLPLEELERNIKSIGLYKSKAKHVKELSEIIAQKYGKDAGTCGFEEISENSFPQTREDFMELPGVGRKTANVMLNVLYHAPVMPVDTHLLRLAPRLGFSEAKTPEAVEKDLLEKIPQKYLHDAHHWLILHGRYVCTARNPRCADCILNAICPKNGLNGNDEG